jgi:hypothetical protein
MVTERALALACEPVSNAATATVASEHSSGTEPRRAIKRSNASIVQGASAVMPGARG